MNLSAILLFYAKHGFLKSLRRSCYRKFCRRNRGREFKVATRYHTLMKIVIGDTVDNEIYLKGYFEAGTSAVMQKLCGLSDCLVDVGCNIGYYSCLFGKSNPNASVFPIDPNPQLIERTKENLKMNQIERYQTFNYGVSSSSDKMTFYVPERRHSLGSFIRPADKIGKVKTLEVEVKKLGDIIPMEKINRAVLKIDAEEYEWEILSGLSPSDAQKFNYIICEFVSDSIKHASHSEKELLGIPWFSEYSIYKITPAGSLEPFSHQEGHRYSFNLCLIRKGAEPIR